MLYRKLMAGHRELPAKSTILTRIVLFVVIIPWTAYGLYRTFERDFASGAILSVVAVLLLGFGLYRLRNGHLHD